MNFYDDRLPLIFIHVPKTAGGSSRMVFAKWFGAGFQTHYRDEARGTLPRRAAATDDPNRGHPLCIYGHFNRNRGFGVELNYPDIRQFVTILRDPLEMMISRYYYSRQMRAQYRRPTQTASGSLAAFLQKGTGNMLNHFPRPVSWENHKDIIEEYFLEIGFTESLAPSLERMAAVLGQRFDPARLGVVNQTPRDGQSLLSPELRADFQEKSRLEYAVYAYAKARFAAGPAATP